MRLKAWPLLMIVVLCSTLGTAACSLIGYGVGSGIDAVSTRRVSPDLVQDVPPGTRLIVWFQDSTLLEGRLAGVDTLSHTLALVEHRGREPTRVSLHEVVRIQRTTKSGRLHLGIVGGVVDVLTIIAMAACAGQGGLMSC